MLANVLPKGGQDIPELDVTFRDLGGTSLNAMKLIALIHDKFGVDVPMKMLFQNSLKEIIQFIDRSVHGTQGHTGFGDSKQGRMTANEGATAKKEIDWAEEVKLENYLPSSVLNEYAAAQCPDDPATVKGIFLTGATGFLGGYLLFEILERFPRAHVWCLVRSTAVQSSECADSVSPSAEEGEFYNNERQNWRPGKARLLEQLKSILCWRDEFEPRIKAVAGDLAEEDFGLSKRQFSLLTEKTQIIFHCGAWINSILDYSTLKAANVTGTVTALKLAFSPGQTRTFHHVSTTSVYARRQKRTFTDGILEDYPSSEVSPVDLRNGYRKSKWVAEQLCIAAREKGLPLTIYRPGRDRYRHIPLTQFFRDDSRLFEWHLQHR